MTDLAAAALLGSPGGRPAGRAWWRARGRVWQRWLTCQIGYADPRAVRPSARSDCVAAALRFCFWGRVAVRMIVADGLRDN